MQWQNLANARSNSAFQTLSTKRNVIFCNIKGNWDLPEAYKNQNSPFLLPLKLVPASISIGVQVPTAGFTDKDAIGRR